MTNISGQAFAHNTALKTVILTSNLIGYIYAPNGSTIYIADNGQIISDIGDQPFAGCTSLTNAFIYIQDTDRLGKTPNMIYRISADQVQKGI